MGILQITGIIITGAIALVFLFRWILMVENIIEQQRIGQEKTQETTQKLIDFVDKNIKERVIYTSQDKYDNTEKLVEAMPDGEIKEDFEEEMTMENIQTMQGIKFKSEEGKQ